MKPLIIYHGNCADGFTAAWLANMAYAQSQGAKRRPDDWVVDHHAGVYNEAPPDVADRDVFILDFSYPVDVLTEMAQRAHSITMIDHHATAIAALEGFSHPKVRLVLSDKRSGAYLTAKFFWPENDPVEMVQLVDDRDRWVFANPKTKPFHAALFSRPYAIGEWNRLASDINVTVGEGRAVERFIAKQTAELVAITKEMSVVGGWSVPVANLPYTHASDACQLMLDQHPDVPFAATWYGRHDGKLVFSLRSRGGSTVDVGVIAKQFGGGGHRHASGFAVDSWPT